MTTFDDRERAFEGRFVHDAEIQFKVVARRNRLLGQWAAGLLGLTREEADAYAMAVVQTEFEEYGDEDVVRKLLGDLSARGIDIDEASVRRAMAEKGAEAERQVMDGR